MKTSPQVQAAEELYDLIAELTHEGMSAKEIAVRLGVSERTVARGRRKRECTRCVTGTPITEQERQQILAMLDDGAFYNEVGRTMNRNPRYLKRRFPGYTWDPAQVAQAAAWGRKLARLERDLRQLEYV